MIKKYTPIHSLKYTYLQKTKVAIRKWQLGQIDESERFLGGWGDLA